MPTPRLWLSLSTAALLLLGGLFDGAASADATPAVILSGTAPAAVHGPGTVAFSYAISLPSAVDSATLLTHQDAGLPAVAGSVTLDGAAVPSGQVSKPSSVDLAVQVGSLATDGLTAGSHTLTFVATVGNGAAAVTSSTLTLEYSLSGRPGSATSEPVVVSTNSPDLSVVLTPGSGEEQLGYLGSGRNLSFSVDVTNLGYGTPHSSLLIDLPPGTKLGPDGVSHDSDGSPLNCQASPDAAHQLCDLGTLYHANPTSPTLDVEITTTGSEPVGQLATVTVSATPNPGEGIDSNPTNNSASLRYQYSGTARLSYSITPARSSVPLGQQTSITMIVHNAGPQPANQTIAFGAVVGSNFQITGFTGNTTPPAGSGYGSTAVRAATSRSGALRALTVPPPSGSGSSGPGVPGAASSSADNLVLWFAGDIPAGHSVSAVLTVKATALGTAHVGLLAFSTAGDPNCPDLNCDLTSVAIQAVPVVPLGLAAPAAAGAAPLAVTRPTLANTGAASEPAIGLGVALVAAGLLLTGAGRRGGRRSIG